jgi:hypothetical protein
LDPLNSAFLDGGRAAPHQLRLLPCQSLTMRPGHADCGCRRRWTSSSRLATWISCCCRRTIPPPPSTTDTGSCSTRPQPLPCRRFSSLTTSTSPATSFWCAPHCPPLYLPLRLSQSASHWEIEEGARAARRLLAIPRVKSGTYTPRIVSDPRLDPPPPLDVSHPTRASPPSVAPPVASDRTPSPPQVSIAPMMPGLGMMGMGSYGMGAMPGPPGMSEYGANGLGMDPAALDDDKDGLKLSAATRYAPPPPLLPHGVRPYMYRGATASLTGAHTPMRLQGSPPIEIIREGSSLVLGKGDITKGALDTRWCHYHTLALTPEG